MSPRSPILVVDAAGANRAVKGRILAEAGFDVLEAGNGEEALALIRERAPALVLLDVKLPDGNGHDLCTRIKEDPALPQTSILLTSASHGDVGQRVAALEAGAYGYLVEPMEREELLANVRSLLRLRRAEAERESAVKALREADRRKDEFLAMLAHELRNPLAPIRNAVEILRRSDNQAVQARARELIGRQTEHLTRLVDDLLEMSRITQGKFVLQRSVVNLQWVIESALEIARPLAERYSQELDVSMPAEPVWVDVDPVRLSQAIGNLQNNACKFSPPSCRISLHTRLAPGVEIVVEDRGVGIEPELLPRVFDLFAQIDPSFDRARGGLGIGLSLVKALVEMHGGSVDAQSEGAGKGSRFTIRLPASARAAPPPPEKRMAPASHRESRRVLVVEDSADAAEAMRMLLSEYGHHVSTVTDASEAIAVAKAFRPEVILLDIGLPGIDGYELARRFRAMSETREARMIAVTGYGQAGDHARSREAGFDEHLVKPVDPEKLVGAINAAAA
jgi:signal transduction histidine kinase